MRSIDKILRLAYNFEIKVLAATMSVSEAEQIIGLSGQYNQEKLNKTYRKLILLNHPDVSKHPDATVKTQKINAAYERLKGAVSEDWDRPEPTASNQRTYYPRPDYYRYEEEYKEEVSSFVVESSHYVSAKGGRSYSPDYNKTNFGYDAKASKSKFSTIREAVDYINELVKYNLNQAIMIEKETPSTGSIHSEVLGLIKYDHVDKRWYVVPPQWHPKSKDDTEHQDRNPHRSWTDFRNDLINKFNEQYEL